jgi:hypothetical protein
MSIFHMLGISSLFSKGAQYFSYRWVNFLYSQMALSVSHILLDIFSLISKGTQHFSYRWVIFFYSQKVLSISHMLLDNFSIFSKDAQYFSYPYRWVIFHYSPRNAQYFSCQVVCWLLINAKQGKEETVGYIPITSIVCWYKTLYQVEPVMWTSITATHCSPINDYWHIICRMFNVIKRTREEIWR